MYNEDDYDDETLKELRDRHESLLKFLWNVVVVTVLGFLLAIFWRV